MPRKLTEEQLKDRVLYSGRWVTPEQKERMQKYQAEWSRKHPGKSHKWRENNRELANSLARKNMEKLRQKRGSVKMRELGRRWRGYPEPTRPEPLVCEICGKPDLKGRALHLDHDHANGKFRGWLCDMHNRGLGYFKDDPDLLLKAIQYLLVNTIHN